MSKKSGISLIILVITIIIMIIIAATIILTFTDNNIIEKASSAVKEHNEEQTKENLEYIIIEYTSKYGKYDNIGVANLIEEKGGKIISSNKDLIVEFINNKYIIYEDGKVEDLKINIVKYVGMPKKTSGINYIDTGIKFNANMKMEIRLLMSAGNGGRVAFGERSSQNTASRGFFMTDSGIVVADDAGWKSYYNVSYGKETIISYTGNTLVMDGKTYNTEKQSTNVLNKTYLFCLNQNGTACFQCGLDTKIYYYKVWDQNNKLIMDLIPAVDEKGDVCFYDNVTAKYFNNKGPDKFTTETN